MLSVVTTVQVQCERSCREAVHEHYTRDMDNLRGTGQVETKCQFMAGYESPVRLLSLEPFRAGGFRSRRVSMVAVNLPRLPVRHPAL